MENLIFFVTGATNGIGKHTALRLAQTGATVLIHGRVPARVDSTVKYLREATANQNIEGYVGDLASFASIRKLSDELHSTQTHIDVLINNAGVYETSRKESQDGYELTFAVNVLAPFLLTSLLLDLLKVGHESHIINVSSISHAAASNLDFDNMQFKHGYGNGHKAYEQSKLCEIMFTLDMAQQFIKDGIRVNCLDPGTVNTQMLLKGWGEIGIAVEEANNEFLLATDSQLAGVTGEYFVDMKKSRAASMAYDQQMRNNLWKRLVEMTGAQFK